MSTVLESQVEKAFLTGLRDLPVYWLKLNVRGRRGWPDRMLLLPRGRAVFVEFKRPGGKLSALQALVISNLRKQGFTVGVYDDVREALNFIYRELGF